MFSSPPQCLCVQLKVAREVNENEGPRGPRGMEESLKRNMISYDRVRFPTVCRGVERLMMMMMVRCRTVAPVVSDLNIKFRHLLEEEERRSSSRRRKSREEEKEEEEEVETEGKRRWRWRRRIKKKRKEEEVID